MRELFALLPNTLSDVEITSVLERVGLPLSTLAYGMDTQISGMGEKSGAISGGQKRRLAIARALAIDPSLVIADEPTADLDPQSAQEILLLLHEIARSGAIVIAVLHAPDQVIAGAREVQMVQR